MDGGGRSAGVAAGLAALIGAGLLSVAVLRLTGSGGEAPESSAATTNGSTTTDGPTTTDGSTMSTGGGSASTGGVDAEGYVVITDETGRISARVPAEWADVSGSSWVTSNIDVGPSLAASVDIARWVEEWDTPGVFFGVDDVRSRTVEEMLADADFEGPCVRSSREPYDHGVHSGEVEWYADCGEAGSTFVQAAVEGPGYVVFVQLVVLDESQAEPVLTGWSVSGG